MKLSIIVPVYNEKDHLEKTVQRIKKVNLNIEKEIIIIDDFSTDGTRKILENIPEVKKFFHSKNYGKGAAVKTGIKNSTGDIIIIQDADNEYSPEEYPLLIGPILKRKTKVVYGSRLLKKNKKAGPLFYLGGKTITLLTNILYGSRITDEPTCYKIFHKDLKKILVEAESNCFAWEPETTAKILRRKFKILEVPISYNPRTKAQGKKIKFKDGLLAIKTLIKWRFKNFN